jgi:SpoVK/Ycf46/Vps4 family AAA+-type ATPase
MSQMPSFLKIGNKPNAGRSTGEPYRMQDYKPLLGLWLIDLSLTRRWVEKPPGGSLGGTFCDNDFIEVTGLAELMPLLRDDIGFDDEDDNPFALDIEEEPDDDEQGDAASLQLQRQRKPAAKSKRSNQRTLKTRVMALLKGRRKELLALGVSADLPLFQNVERLGRMVSLNDTECAVLTFAACMGCFPVFRAALAPNTLQVSDDGLASLLSTLTGQPTDLIRKALRRDSVLLTSGLIRVDRDDEELEDKISLVRDLQNVMLDELASDEELGRRVLRPAKAGTLALADFPHLATDARLLLDYLTGVDQTQACGANILLYGPPGTGKTEFAKALAAQAGISLFDIGFADEDGNPIDGEQRLHSLNFCQRALKGKSKVALLFDEVEDVLPGRPGGGLFGMMFGNKSDSKGGKAWINRALEENPVPTIWITNDANIDTAYLRRFDYALALRIPPRAVRTRMALEHLGQHAPNTAAVAAIAELDDLLPAQLERAARVARLSAVASPALAWQHAEMALAHSRAVLGQTRKNLKAKAHTQYSLEFLNTNADIASIITGLRVRPQATFCLYGPSGTGKSQLARHIADALGKPILIKRASDLMDKFVGGTEKLIAAMFEQALDEDALLLLDEADSFLSDRTGANHRWEATQTNELLTQLECFEGLFFATTNLMDTMDAACLRRFSHKIKFDYLNPDQRLAMFVQEFCRLGGDQADTLGIEAQVRGMEGLTPGDFAVVGRHRAGLSQPIRALEFLIFLQHEASVKRHGQAKMGF